VTINVPARRAIAALSTALALSLGACDRSPTDPPTPAAVATPIVTTPSGSFTVDQLPTLIGRVQPSVVTIITNLGLGSGVVWSSNGMIVTNNHVIAGAKSITVQFADGDSTGATLHAADAVSDLAVLDVARTNLPAAKWASDTPALGTFVVALGSPLGLENSASTGIVSGLGRNLPDQGGAPLVDLLQTSAPISPGNSGGALFNDQGTVVGMSEAYLPPSTGAVSIGLAIPAPTVTRVVKQMLASGTVNHTVRAFTG